MMGIYDKKKNTSMYKDATSLQIKGMLLLFFGDKKRFIHFEADIFSLAK